jgi:hypothetical protein
MSSDPREDFRARERPARTSQVLRDYAESVTAERVSLQDVVAALGDRGLGVLIAIFAVPNIFPSTVPFGNVATGLPVVFLAFHLMLGRQTLMLPRFLARRSIGAKLMRSVTPKLAAVLARIEKLLKPRLLAVTGSVAERIIGALCLFLSVISTLPIPFAHNLPAIGLCMIGLGLIEHDGAAVLLGAVIGIAGVVLLILVLLGVAAGLGHLPFH